MASELQLEIFAEVKNWDRALEVAQRLVRENPQNTEYLVQLANIAVKAEEPELAQNTLSRLYPLWKEDPEKLRQLAALQVRFGNKSTARKSLARALKLDKESYLVKLDLARLDLAEGKIEQPRLTTGQKPVADENNCWVLGMDQIVWTGALKFPFAS